MRLEEAVAVFGRQLPISVAMLRTEIRKGRLTPALVAGKFFVTPHATEGYLQAMKQSGAPALAFADSGGISSR